MARQERLPVRLSLIIPFTRPQPILTYIRPIAARRRLVNIVRPILDLGRTLHSLLVRLPGKVPELPGEEPREHDGHPELDRNDTYDEHKGEIQHNLGCHTADAVRVDEPDSDDIL